MKTSMLILRAITVIFLVIIAVAGVVFLFRYDGPGDDSTTNKTPTTNQPTKSTDKQKPVDAPLALYYVALNDNGKAGERIGCEDSIVPVLTESVAVDNRLKEAISRMLADTSQTIGDTELYNVLYQADLKLESASVEDGVAKVALNGTLNLRGVCDNPRVQAQLEETAKAAADVDKVEIKLNGKTLADAISLQ